MNALSASDILTRDEIKAVMDRLRKGRDKKYIRMDEIIFRLAICCGLRVSEMCQLTLGDLTLSGPRPSIRVQKKNTKGKKRMRNVPLWWDDGNLGVLAAWVDKRKADGAKSSDLLLVTQRRGKEMCKMGRLNARGRWHTAIRVLGNERRRQLSIHCGRHTFASMAIAAGRTLVEVQQALGHSSLTSTAVYLHIVENPAAKQLYS
jgi:integrase